MGVFPLYFYYLISLKQPITFLKKRKSQSGKLFNLTIQRIKQLFNTSLSQFLLFLFRTHPLKPFVFFPLFFIAIITLVIWFISHPFTTLFTLFPVRHTCLYYIVQFIILQFFNLTQYIE